MSKQRKEVIPVATQREVQHSRSVVDSHPQLEGEGGVNRGGEEGEREDLCMALSLNYEVCLTVEL